MIRTAARVGSLALAGALAACYGPKLASPGFYCHVSDHPACPGDQLCVDGRCQNKSQAVMPDGGALDGPPVVADGGAPIDMAQQAPADLAGGKDSAVLGCGVKINEIQTAGTGGLTDEFVELFNSCSSPAALNGYKLVYRSAGGSTDVALVTFGNQSVAAGKWFVAGHSGFSGAPDVRYSSGSMASGGGGVAVLDAGGAIVDSVGYGTATNAFVRTAAAPAPPSGSSIGRKPDGQDTGDNSADLPLTTMSTPGAGNL